MAEYRVGNHWGITIVREGEATHAWRPFNVGETVCVEAGCRLSKAEHAQLVAVVVNGDTALAERICALLNREGLTPGLEDAPCQEETWSWKHFSTEVVDGYWIRCTLSGPHDEHADTGNTGLTWRSEPEPPGAPAHGTGR